MIIVSSFTYRLFPRSVNLCNSIKNNIDGVTAIIYYEDVDGDPFPPSIFEKINWIKWVNLNSTDRKGLNKIDSFEQFRKARSVRDAQAQYMNFHARFWFRKVVAIRACLHNNPDNDLVLWSDADSKVFGQLLEGCTETAKNGDIGHIKRVGKPTDTGLILFNLKNNLVKEFIEEWYQLYVSGRIFNEMPYWADHYAFDYVLKEKRFSSLKSYDLQKCKTFNNLIGHSRHGHLIMRALRERKK